ncbi:MAG TPA: sugar ABC transporter substrate-binding protein [Ktedonobacterales bacterium]|nr:sugar ABC transporter substrate-binding protein [Ktedonobacterales bacterium]
MRSWHKRASLGLAFLLATITMLAACGTPSQQSGPVQLTFWSFNQQIIEQASAFNKTHPNIHVTALKEPSGPNQYYPKVITAVHAGNAPDVALIEYQYIPTMVANSALVDISQYGAASAQSQFASSAWSQVTRGSAIYGFPQDTGPMGLFYRKGIFQRAGISSPPATWADFAADAVKIHALGPNYYIASFPPQSTGWIQSLMWQYGAQWFKIDSSKNAWKVSINSAASKAVANYWQDLINKGLVSTVADFSNDWGAGLDKGTIASWPSAVWGQGVVTSDAQDTSGKWAVAPMPQWTAGANLSGMWGGSAISVIAGTKHPKEAEEFAQWYLTNTQSLTIGVKEIGWFPANLSARQFPEVTSPNAFFSNQVIDTIFANANVPNTWTWPPNLTDVNQFMGDDFNAAIANHTSLSAALDKLQTQVIQDLQSKNINVES